MPACYGGSGEAGFGVLGGGEACRDSWQATHTLALLQQDGTEACSGVRIGRAFILTAAHCLSATVDQLKVGYGPQGAAAGATTPGATHLTAEEGVHLTAMVAHPRFAQPLADGQTNDHDDLALFLFTGQLAVAPAEVASFGDFPINDEQLAKMAHPALIKAGFGEKGFNDTSAASLTTVSLDVAHVSSQDREITYRERSGKGACDGDSGGPAFVPGSMQLIGITSRGPGINNADGTTTDAACDTGGGVDTDVRFYRAWLNCAAASLVAEKRGKDGGLGLAIEAGDQSAADCAGNKVQK